MNMTLVTFQELVGRVSGLGEDSDFVEAAVLREARERRGELLRERAQAVANDAIQRASGWKRVPAKALGGESRELGTSPDAAFVSKALGKRLEPWAEELREEGFGNPRAPFPKIRRPRPSGSRCRAKRTGSNGNGEAYLRPMLWPML
jgi:hypothetical protein